MKPLRQPPNRFQGLAVDEEDSDDGPEQFVVRKDNAATKNAEQSKSHVHESLRDARGRGNPWPAGRGRPKTAPTMAIPNHRGGYQSRGSMNTSQSRRIGLQLQVGKSTSAAQNRIPSVSQEDRQSVMQSNALHIVQNKSSKAVQNKSNPLSLTKSESSRRARDLFPRVRPLNALTAISKVSQAEQEVDEKQAMQALRRKPHDAIEFGASGAFIWPMKDADPAELGTDLAKLDQIRKDFNCTICFDQRCSAFRLYGHEAGNAEEDVSNAIEALKVVLSEHMSRKSKMVKMYMLDPPLNQRMTSEIRILEANDPAASCLAAGTDFTKKTQKVCVLAQSENQAGTEWKTRMGNIAAKNLKLLSLAMSECLKKTLYRQGYVQIRALFGTFVFHRYITSYPGASPPAGIEPMIPFVDNLRSSITDGTLYRLSTEAHLFECVTSCNDIFETYGNENCSLADVRPTHIGMWTFASENLKDPVDLQLRVETSLDDDPDEEPLVRSSEWRSSAEHQSSRYLELFMIKPRKFETFSSREEAETFLTERFRGVAWKLEANSQQWRRNIEQRLRSFQSTVSTLKPSSGNVTRLGSVELVFDFRGFPGLKDFYQKTQWKYRLKADRNVIFEVSRLDRFDAAKIKEHAKGGLSAEARQPAKTEWEACMYHELWDEHLGQNSTLGAGKRATWDPDLDNFFPVAFSQSHEIAKGTGFADFIELLQATSTMLSQALMQASEQRTETEEQFA